MSGKLSAIERQASRLAKRFERLAEMTPGDEFDLEMRAATAQGGLLLRDCYNARLMSFGDDSGSLAEMFQDSESAVVAGAPVNGYALKELIHSSWFLILAGAVAEHGNLHALTTVSRSESISFSIGKSGNHRTRAYNYAEFFHDLAEHVAAGSAEPVADAEAGGEWVEVRAGDMKASATTVSSDCDDVNQPGIKRELKPGHDQKESRNRRYSYYVTRECLPRYIKENKLANYKGSTKISR